MATAESTGPLPELLHKTCSKCHQSFPATREYFHKHNSKDGLNPSCRFCRNARNKMYYATQRAQVLARQKKRYVTQRTRILARGQASYASTHPDYRPLQHPPSPRQHYAPTLTPQEKQQAYTRTYQQRHPERRRLAMKKWREANKDTANARAHTYRTLYPERVKASQQKYTKANPDKMRIKNHRQRARRLALPVNYTEAMWQEACAYFHHACAVCGREEGFFWTLAQDHWIPLSDPSCPGTVATNIVPLCHPKEGHYESCNTTKQAQDPRVWLRAKLSPRQARAKLKEIEAFFVYMQTLTHP